MVACAYVTARPGVQHMADLNTYNRVVLTMQSPFAKGGVSSHKWSLKFSLSGTAMVPADVEPTGLDLFDPVSKLCSSNTSLIGILGYPPGSDVNIANLSYAVGHNTGAHNAYTPGGVTQQLEVCAVCRAPVGLNVKGKKVWLHKYVHDVWASPTNSQVLQDILGPQAAVFAKWQTGAGPHSLLVVQPSTGTPAGTWAVESPLFTRQLRRGQKKTSP